MTGLKPLYLDGDPALQVSLDGPALRVEAEDRAGRLFPLPRLSRVICWGNVQWSTDAVLACADAGVCISFLGPEGSTRALVVGRVNGRSGLRQRMEDLLVRPDWREEFDGWRRSEERRAVLVVLKQMRWDLRCAAQPEALRQRLNAIAEELSNAACARMMARVQRALLLSHMSELCGREGLDILQSPAPGSRPDLPRCLAELLSWHLQSLRIGWLRRRTEWSRRRRQQPSPPTRAQVTHLYQSRSARIEREARLVLARLHRWLADLG